MAYTVDLTEAGCIDDVSWCVRTGAV